MTTIESSNAPKGRNVVQVSRQLLERIRSLAWGERISDNLFPADYTGGKHFKVPSYAFRPDEWTGALLAGLSKFEGFEGKRVWEIGIGTGINAAYVLENKRPRVLYGSDINGRLTRLAEGNIAQNVSSPNRRRFRPLRGDRNLASGVHIELVDIAYACIPQVVKSVDLDLHEGDNVAHYYDPALYPSGLHHLGLGLNDCALRELHRTIPDGGEVMLNLGGRPGFEALAEMFFANGYEPRLLHEATIPQHPGTSLATLAAVESYNGRRFEFFSSPEGESGSRISATEAEKRRQLELPVFHKIYVFVGRKVGERV